MKSLGQTAYEAFVEPVRARTPGADLTLYSELPTFQRAAWDASARAVELQLPTLRFFAINGHTEVFLALSEAQARSYHEKQLGVPVTAIAEVDPYQAVGFVDEAATERGTLIDVLHHLAAEGDVALPCQIWSARAT